MANKARDSDGRFCGARRVNVEDVPRLPTFPARWTLDDSRGHPYFVFWTSDDGSLSHAVRLERIDQGEAIRLSTPDGGWFRVPIVHRKLPRKGGVAALYRCPLCWRLRRYLYLLPEVGKASHRYQPPQCQACAGLRWASQGRYRSAFDRALLAGLRGPYPRHPWDPLAVSDPRLVADEFSNLILAIRDVTPSGPPLACPPALCTGAPARAGSPDPSSKTAARRAGAAISQRPEDLFEVPLPASLDDLEDPGSGRLPPDRPAPFRSRSNPPKSWLGA